MPRPKRTKVAPSKPISFATIVAEKSKPSNPEPVLSPASGSITSSRKTNTSDDSDGVVTANKTGVNRRGVAPQIATMSGALAVEDFGEKRPRPLSSRKRITLSRIAREADHTKAVENLRAQRDAALAADKTGDEGNRGEVQVPWRQTGKVPFAQICPSAQQQLSIDRGSQPTQVSKARATPSRETSILAIENFKRRPRQPSILQIAQAQNLAEGSSIDDTLDDFNPDDESTPVHQTHIGIQHRFSSSSSGHHSSSRKRKLSTPDIQVPVSQSQELHAQPSSPALSLSDSLSAIVAEDFQPSPPLPALPTVHPAFVHDVIDSDTLAPPRSSSPASPQKEIRQTKSRIKKSQVAPKVQMKAPKFKTRKQSSTVLPPRSSSPTQTSPSIASKNRSPLRPITTSALQNLLPRRRRVMSRNKENNVFELSTSSDVDSLDAVIDADADELSYHAATKPHRKAGTEKAKRTGKKGKAAANGVKSKSKTQQAAKRLSMTYTRKENIEADENEDVGSGGEGEDGGAVAKDGKASEEMKRMAAKFREVDDWGLEFEEVTGSSDRMRDAR